MSVMTSVLYNFGIVRCSTNCGVDSRSPGCFLLNTAHVKVRPVAEACHEDTGAADGCNATHDPQTPKSQPGTFNPLWVADLS